MQKRLYQTLGWACLSATFAACGSAETGARLVELELLVSTDPPAQGANSDYVRDDGWRVHLDAARMQLGSVYLRAPQRAQTASFWRNLLSIAHAHVEHAQTTTEGQIIGEHLEPMEVDALAQGAKSGGLFVSEENALDRLSVMLGLGLASDVPIANLKGYAEREGQRVDFDCALRIEQDPDDTPENIEERRRVDKIYLPHASSATQGAQLHLRLQLWRWLERIDFASLVGSDSFCATPQSQFVLQWYLGVRRPEAFAAEIITKE